MALQHVEGTVYRIHYRNNDFTTQTLTIVGGYSPEVVWAIANCLLTCVKTTWFNEDNTVQIDRIEAVGDAIEVPTV